MRQTKNRVEAECSSKQTQNRLQKIGPPQNNKPRHRCKKTSIPGQNAHKPKQPHRLLNCRTAKGRKERWLAQERGAMGGLERWRHRGEWLRKGAAVKEKRNRQGGKVRVAMGGAEGRRRRGGKRRKEASVIGKRGRGLGKGGSKIRSESHRSGWRNGQKGRKGRGERRTNGRRGERRTNGRSGGTVERGRRWLGFHRNRRSALFPKNKFVCFAIKCELP